MPVSQNGDFSSGLDGWRVSDPAGPTAPTFDEATGPIIFGRADNDVQFNDFIEQDVVLGTNEEFTLSLTLAEVGGSPFAGFGISVELVELNDDGSPGFNTQFLGSFQVGLDDVNDASLTFTSNFDNAVFRIRGQFGFGTMDSVLVIDDIELTNTALACFTKGTMIDCPSGERAIEHLQVGDLVNTLDDGPCVIRWIGARPITGAEMQLRPDWRPITLKAGTIAPGMPSRDLTVSPAHRVLLREAKLNLLCGETEAFASANALRAVLKGVDFQPENRPTTYYHILFDKHQVVMSNGLATESFFPCQANLERSDIATQDEVISLFPELAQSKAQAFPLARSQLKAHECVALFSERDGTC